MNTLVEMTIPVEDFALEETFTALPEARFELLPTVAYRPEIGPPFLRVESDRPVLESLRTDPTLDSVERMTSSAESTTVSVEWGAAARTVFETMVDADVFVSTVSGTGRRWTFQLRTSSREAASEMYHRCADRGISVEVTQLEELDAVADGNVSFSSEQLEVLQLAVEYGYYDIPRGITVSELADRLDVSHQAVSERIRRAHDHLIGHSIRL